MGDLRVRIPGGATSGRSVDGHVYACNVGRRARVGDRARQEQGAVASSWAWEEERRTLARRVKADAAVKPLRHHRLLM